MTLLAITVIILALLFDYINGFHDSANSIATIVATRVLKPVQAVLWAAFFNLVAAFTLGTGVASSISKDYVDASIVTPHLVFAGLTGAIIWNLATWWLGLPSSSSHALIGGYAGAAVAKAGFQGRQKDFGHGALRNFGSQVSGGNRGIHRVSPVVAGQVRQTCETSVYAAIRGLAVLCQTSCSQLADNQPSL